MQATAINERLQAKTLPAAMKPSFVLGQDMTERWGKERCPIIKSAADVASIFSGIAELDREVMVVGAVDCKCALTFCTLLAVGSSDRVAMRIGDAFYGVIRTSGTAIFLVHNHPSGSLTPSKLDFQLTQDVAEAGLLLGYPLLDHVIVSVKGYRSLMSSASLPKQTLKITPVKSRAAADGITALANWNCSSCGAGNSLAAFALQDTIAENRWLPARCNHCKTFTWLESARKAARK